MISPILNPYIFPIEGDLSRADFVVLTQLCRGKDVVEYGVGGSTLLFSRIAKSVVSFETKQVWADRVTEQLAQVKDKRCEPEIVIIGEEHDGSTVKGLVRTCDVFFNDGWAAMRHHFLLEFWLQIRVCCILHDTRATYAANVVKKFIDAYDLEADKEKYPWGRNPYLASLKTIEWCYLESNMAVLFRRNCELYWEDWKRTESGDNRNGYGVG